MEFVMKAGKIEVKCDAEEHGDLRPVCRVRISRLKRRVQLAPKVKPRVERYVEMQFVCPICSRSHQGELKGDVVFLEGE